MTLLYEITRRTWTTKYYKDGDDLCRIIFIHQDGSKYEGLIDLDDFEWVHKLSLYPALNRGGYIMYCIRDEKGMLHNKYLHKTLLSDPILQTDHINKNSFDNRRSNLRLVTCSENLRNASMQANNTLGRKGLAVKRDSNGNIIAIRACYSTKSGQKETSFSIKKYGYNEALNRANDILDNLQKAHNITYSSKTKYDNLGKMEGDKLQRLSKRKRQYKKLSDLVAK